MYKTPVSWALWKKKNWKIWRHRAGISSGNNRLTLNYHVAAALRLTQFATALTFPNISWI